MRMGWEAVAREEGLVVKSIQDMLSRRESVT